MNSKVSRHSVADKNKSIADAKHQAVENASKLINFSFKYLDTDNEKFPCSSTETNYHIQILKRIKNVCSWQKQEFIQNSSKALRIHPIKWEETSERDGFKIPGEDQIVDTPYQFSVSGNEHGRVHGFFIQNTFFVVWFDKSHMLYPEKK